MPRDRAPRNSRSTLRAPARFNPGYSILGRALRKRMLDARQAGTCFLIVLSSLVLVLAAAQFLAWTYLEPAIAAAPRGNTALGFWTGQIAAVLLLFFTAVLGRAPSVRITLHNESMELCQGARTASVDFSEIMAVHSAGALSYHREHGPYADVQPFISGMPPSVLVVLTTRAVFGVGLPPPEHEYLLSVLREHSPKVCASEEAHAV